MSDGRDIGEAFNEGLEPVMAETPPIPEWESLQFETEPRAGGMGQWWVAFAAAAVIVLVGFGSLLWAGRIGGTDENSGDNVPGGSDVTAPAPVEPTSIEGRWVLESWEDGEDQIEVEVDVNTVDEPWIEFTADFTGESGSFIGADGTGTAGTVAGSTGCNLFGGVYEYSGGFLVLQRIEVNAAGCEPNRAELVMVAMLQTTSAGIEVIMGPDRMKWHGSNLEGQSYPLTFRRDGSSPSVATDPPSPTTTLTPDEGLAIRVYDVDGIEVVTPSLMADLPERAATVEFHTTVIDSGDGPILCVGIVLDSLPPQCSGPVAAGLDMEGWSQEASGVLWGERSVVVTWPPVDGVVEVLDQSEYAPPRLESPTQELPAECEDAELRAASGPINDYAGSLGEINGGLYVTNDGELVLQVVGDPAPHREALAEIGGACVIEVTRSEADQLAIQDSIHPLLVDIPELVSTYSSSTGPGGRVDFHLPVVDGATARAIAALVDDPTAIRIVGMGVLHP